MLRSDVFPYWDRLQSIRTSALWKAQADIAGWLANAPQVSASCEGGGAVSSGRGEAHAPGR